MGSSETWVSSSARLGSSLPHDSSGNRRPNHERRRHRRGGGRLRGVEKIGEFDARTQPVHQREDAVVLRASSQGHFQMFLKRQGGQRRDVPHGTGKGELSRSVAHVGPSVQHRGAGKGAHPRGNRGGFRQGRPRQPRGLGVQVVHGPNAQHRCGQGHWSQLFRGARIPGRRPRHVPDWLQSRFVGCLGHGSAGSRIHP